MITLASKNTPEWVLTIPSSKRLQIWCNLCNLIILVHLLFYVIKFQSILTSLLAVGLLLPLLRNSKVCSALYNFDWLQLHPQRNLCQDTIYLNSSISRSSIWCFSPPNYKITNAYDPCKTTKQIIVLLSLLPFLTTSKDKWGNQTELWLLLLQKLPLVQVMYENTRIV